MKYVWATLAFASACSSNASVSAVDAGAQTDDGSKPPAPFTALVYPQDPVTDQRSVTPVVLPTPTDPDGKLTNGFTKVHNCRREEGGGDYLIGDFKVGRFCHTVQDLVPGPDGTYLSAQPPEDDGDPEDQFSEVQMYWHVNKMHDWYANSFGLHALDFPLMAVTNAGLWIDPDILPKGSDMEGGWQPFENALFLMPGGFQDMGLEVDDNGAIVFGQAKKTDFSYDASVIYHEYTHAMVSTTRLSAFTQDVFGFDNMPAAMNEAFADYFSCSLRNDPHIGAYALTNEGHGDWLKRDLSKPRVCPDDLTTEIHADGKILGSALWAMREQLGQEVADGIILKALLSFTKSTSLQGAGKALVAEAKKVDLPASNLVKKVLDKHGILTCQRIKEYEAFDVDTSADRVPYTVLGKEIFSSQASFPDGVPGYVQFRLQLPAGKAGVTLRWHAKADKGFNKALRALVRREKPVQIDDFSNASKYSADARIDVVQGKDGWQQMTLGAACFAGKNPTHVAFFNTTAATAGIERMEMVPVASMAGAPNPQDCQ
jgi:hypothetical protein